MEGVRLEESGATVRQERQTGRAKAHGYFAHRCEWHAGLYFTDTVLRTELWQDDATLGFLCVVSVRK